MNKTFKTVWNHASGQWVATSEHARSHGKSTSILSKAALALVVTVSGANAYALTDIVGGTEASPHSGNSSITDTDVYIHDGYFKSSTTNGITFGISSAGDTKVTVENINLTTPRTDGHSSSFSVSGSTGAHLEFKGNNTITLNVPTYSDTAVIVSTSGVGRTGDAKITVSGNLDITNQGNWRNFENDGLEANAGENGNAIITHTGTGTIIAAGGHALQARTNAAGKDVEVTLNSSSGKDQIHLSTTGSGSILSSAIGAKGSATSGKVTVSTSAKITTIGTDAHGIYAISAGKAADGKSVEVINSGTISSTGAGASGITAQATASTANGTIKVNNTGEITSARHAIHGLGYDGDVDLYNNSKLETTGYDGAGIRAEQDIRSTTGDITVTTGVNSDIITGDSQSDGIHAYLGREDNGGGAASNGNVTVNAQGKITTSGPSSAEGIFAAITNSQATGDINVTFSGSTIETTGSGVSRGILVRQMGSGDVTVNHFGDLIKTAGNGAHGISIGTGIAGTDGGKAASMGKIELNTTGKIETTTSNAKGIHIDASNQTDGITVNSSSSITTKGASGAGAIEIDARHGAIDSGKITVNQTGGTIETDGTSSHGIYVYTTAQQGDIEVNLTNTTMNLHGGNSDGIGIFQMNANLLQRTNTNIVVNTSGGSITTLDNATTGGIANYGIVVYQDGNADGNITIDNAGTAITTKLGTDGLANGSDAIYAGFRSNASNATGNIKVTNTGKLSTQGVNAAGIRATNNGQGNVTVTNSESIKTTGNTAHGINTVATTGKTTITTNGATGKIEALGSGSYGIYAISTGGDIEVTNDVAITATGTNHTDIGKGIYVSSGGVTPITNGTVIGAVSVTDLNNSTITASSNGIEIRGGSVSIESNSTLNIRSNYQGTGLNTNIGLDAVAYNVNGSSYIEYDGTAGSGITMETNAIGNSSTMGIRASTQGSSGDAANTGSATVIASGDIAVTLKNGSAPATRIGGIEAVTYGIGEAGIHYKTGTLNITAESGTTMTTHAKGYSGFGLMAWSTSLNSTGNAKIITDTGTVINTLGDNIWGVYVDSAGDSTKTASANISSKITTIGANAYAIRAVSVNDAAINIISNNTLTTDGNSAHGIYANSQGAGNIKVENFGDIFAKGTLSYGIMAKSVNGNVEVENNAHIGGRRGISVESQNAASNNVINNYGVIDVGRDIAIEDSSVAGSITVVNNWGTIIGQMNFGDATVVFNNYSPNSLEMRNFIDTDTDDTRDTQSVAIVNFGGGNTTFNNDATGAMRMTAIPLNAIIDATNAITVSGAANFNDPGVLQGQVVGLAEFTNSGEIEMSNNSLAGDVIVITGNSTAGSYGGGNYTANAGSSLHMDTLINQGGANSLSDILVLDDATLGSGATQVYITTVAGGAGGITQDEGIKIIEGLGTQQAGTFALGQDVSYGAYDYLLGQGTGANANNWYLRNNINGTVFYTPIVGAYMGNQHAAANMFNHNILDRRDNVRSPDQTVWGRINYNDLKTDLFGGSAETSINTTLTQFGADLLKRNDWVAGAFISYGQSNVDNKSTITNVSAAGKVKGYQLGVYGSWMPQENKGPYLDFWGHYARYSSDINGANNASASYNSTGYALSIEGGHAFELMKAGNGKAWILEPHAQLIYNRLSADDFTIGSTRYQGNDSSGVQTRLGARFYMQRANGDDGVVPFVEANWLGNYASNKVNANNDKVSAEIGKNVGELKLGAQGKVTDRLSVWGHVGGQAGSDSYKRYEVQLGLGYEW